MDEEFLNKIISDLDPNSLPSEFVIEVKVRYKDETEDFMSMPIYKKLSKSGGFIKPVRDMTFKMNISQIRIAIISEFDAIVSEVEQLQSLKLK